MFGLGLANSANADANNRLPGASLFSSSYAAVSGCGEDSSFFQVSMLFLPLLASRPSETFPEAWRRLDLSALKFCV